MTVMTDDADRHRTEPWHADELLGVDTFRCVYDADPRHGILLVHLPGGRSASVAELEAEGRTVEMPRQTRWRA